MNFLDQIANQAIAIAAAVVVSAVSILGTVSSEANSIASVIV